MVFNLVSNKILHAEYVVSETIKYYTQKKSTVYLCSLDAEKAFDSCNWDILFSKLQQEKGIPLRVTKVLSSLYQQGSAKVYYEGCLSTEFSISQGVRQGSILAPYLYNIYFNLLLSEMESTCSFGTSIFG